MIDPQTGLFNAERSGGISSAAIEDAGPQRRALSLARFSFDEPLDRRTSLDAARLCQPAGPRRRFRLPRGRRLDPVRVYRTDLRGAHVVARRLASVLKHTMLRPNSARPQPRCDAGDAEASRHVHTLMCACGQRAVAAD